MQRIINFSGGKTSALMTILEYKKDDIVLFCDTQREHPKTYEFINKFSSEEGIPVTWITYPGGFDGMLQHYNYKKIPNMFKRFCTTELKISTAKRYLKSIGVTRFVNLIGFRADEKKRVLNHKEKFKKVITEFPLYKLGTTKEMVNHFWSKKSYNLELPQILGNCTLCFMKGSNAILNILSHFPELADPWIEDERKSKERYGHTYFKGITIEELRNIAQNNLFTQQDLQNVQSKFPNCSCTT